MTARESEQQNQDYESEQEQADNRDCYQDAAESQGEVLRSHGRHPHWSAIASPIPLKLTERNRERSDEGDM